MPKNTGPARQVAKNAKAAENAEAARNRDAAGQIARLDSRLGVGVGAARERARLAKKAS